jgi:phospholipase/carboxylesterase
MPTNNSTLISIDQAIIKVLSPNPKTSDKLPILVALHGWQGNENIMDIFTSRYAQQYRILSVRGFIQAKEDSYGWANYQPGVHVPTFDEYADSAARLHTILAQYQTDYSLPNNTIYLMGFSQGAALALAYTVLYPTEVATAASLAGFLPAGASKYGKPGLLDRKPIFVSHGTLDETIPIEQARDAVKKLTAWGADVQYCEDSVGHKVSLTCLKSLDHFFKK